MTGTTTTTRIRHGVLVAGLLLAGCGSRDDAAPALGNAAEAEPEAGAPQAGPAAMKAEPEAGAPQAEVGDAPLVGGQRSLAALGTTLVAALAAHDEAALWALVVSEAEYQTRLFAALASHPGMLRLGPTLAWANQQQDNREAVAKALAEHGGKGYAFASLASTTTEARGGLVVHRDPTLTVTDASGATRVLPLLGVVLEHPASGTFAVLTFAD